MRRLLVAAVAAMVLVLATASCAWFNAGVSDNGHSLAVIPGLVDTILPVRYEARPLMDHDLTLFPNHTYQLRTLPDSSVVGEGIWERRADSVCVAGTCARVTRHWLYDEKGAFLMGHKMWRENPLNEGWPDPRPLRP